MVGAGIFFSLMVAGLAGSPPHGLEGGLTAQGVPAAAARGVAALPPVGTLFAASLGCNPVRGMLGPDVLGRRPACGAAGAGAARGGARGSELTAGAAHS
ncbi:hypothetical protein ACGFZP_29935 [Kitasatospora sp. NPDC048239]|uniref:hypothetical protein n=1 Tax=Kitasatospora sp. NPDC048239 TaxID=3364046 RepID=UPI003712ADD0